jgi:hypothetical protein
MVTMMMMIMTATYLSEDQHYFKFMYIILSLLRSAFDI